MTTQINMIQFDMNFEMEFFDFKWSLYNKQYWSGSDLFTIFILIHL